MEATQAGSQSGCGKVGVAHPSGILIAQWRTAFFAFTFNQNIKKMQNHAPVVDQPPVCTSAAGEQPNDYYKHMSNAALPYISRAPLASRSDHVKSLGLEITTL